MPQLRVKVHVQNKICSILTLTKPKIKPQQVLQGIKFEGWVVLKEGNTMGSTQVQHDQPEQMFPNL
jgi:hypothetical protein